MIRNQCKHKRKGGLDPRDYILGEIALKCGIRTSPMSSSSKSSQEQAASTLSTSAAAPALPPEATEETFCRHRSVTRSRLAAGAPWGTPARRPPALRNTGKAVTALCEREPKRAVQRMKRLPVQPLTLEGGEVEVLIAGEGVDDPGKAGGGGGERRRHCEGRRSFDRFRGRIAKILAPIFNC